MWRKKEKRSLKFSTLYRFSLWENMTQVCQVTSGCTFGLRLSPPLVPTDLEIANTILFEESCISSLRETPAKLFKTNHHQTLKSIFRINRVDFLKRFWHMMDRYIKVFIGGSQKNRYPDFLFFFPLIFPLELHITQV